MINGDIIAFDPGDTTGVAIFNEKGQLLGLNQLPLEGDKGLIKWSARYERPVGVIIFETWVTFRQKAQAQTGSKQKAAQAIGAIKTMAVLKNATLIEQKPDIMKIATKWSGVKLPSDHSQSHQYAAYLHGFFWLHQQGMINTKLENEGRFIND